MRHTAAGILAAAVCDLFPTAQLIGGESHEWGFYYDFLIEQPIDSHFISPLEERMRGIIKEGIPVTILDMMRENAAQLFTHRRQHTKAEIVAACANNIVQVFRFKDFYDYIPGDCVPSTSDVGAIKICEIAPVICYITALEEEVQAVRIQGTAQENPQILKKFLKRREAAKKRDHKLVGPECALYSYQADMGLTDWIWHPKGELVKKMLKDLWKQEHLKEHTYFLETPKVSQPAFLKKCGYYSFPDQDQKLFSEFVHEGKDYLLSPPEARGYFHAFSFQQQRASYRDLPLRFAECSEVFTNTATPRLEGLFRKNSNTADIAHLFCQPEQLKDQLISSLHSIHKIINMVPFEWQCYLVSSEQKRNSRLGSLAQVMNSMNEALENVNIPVTVETSPTHLAGPRIEFRICDAMGREWRGPFLEVNLDLPQRMQLGYVNADGISEQPIMIAYSLFGSLDAFIGLLVEQCDGLFPLWLAPEQVRILPLGGKRTKYIDDIAEKMQDAGIRANVCEGKKPLGNEIHLAERQRIPYMAIIGCQEEKNHLISVRACGREHKDTQMSLEAFLMLIQEGRPGQTINKSELLG